MSQWQIDERARMAVLAELDLDDHSFDDIVSVAARICGTPIGLVSIVEEDRQRFLGRIGTDLTETPRATSFCAHTMLREEPLVVPDATADPRFAGMSLVTAPDGIRFYAGAPIVTEDGVPLGAVCVIDTAPRPEGLTELQRDTLTVLARGVLAELRMRRTVHGARDELRRSEDRLRVLANTMPIMSWSARPDGYCDYFNARWYDFTGVGSGATDGDGWRSLIHEDERDHVWAGWQQALRTGEPFEIEYRLRRHDGQYRWVLMRALAVHDRAGAITRWFGTCADMHEQRMAAEERALVSRELSHRINNIFAVIGGLVALHARSDPAVRPMADELQGALAALSRANDLVRYEGALPAGGMGLRDLLAQLVAPYRIGGRLQIEGVNPLIDPAAVTPLALIFHELATNAAKHGALAHAQGRVGVTAGEADGAVTIVWRERGGPAVAGPPARAGFGTQLIMATVERQLGGTIARDWREDGLTVTLTLPGDRLTAPLAA